MSSAQTFFFALSGGILPALLWLWFWLQEDRLHPEPRRLIFLSFIWGMFMVLFAYPLERFAQGFIFKIYPPHLFAWSQTLLIVAWAVIEELLKFIAAYRSGLSKKEDDEPIDPLIYLITAALGFAALENSLFLLNVFSNGTTFDSIVTGNLRFVGATLLHVISSAMIGIALGFSFCKSRKTRVAYCIGGILTAICLHSIFNLFIMRSENNNIFIVFTFVWAAVVALLAIFEKIKKINKCYRV